MPIKLRQFPAYLMLWLLPSALGTAKEALESSPHSQTIIEGTALNAEASSTYFKEKSDDQKAGDAAMLFHIPGITLDESQGPLGPTNISYRGLSNNRFRIDLEGLSLNNPINGLSDANALFLFAAKRLDSNAQSLSISLPTVHRPFAQGIFGFGSQNTLKIAASTGTPLSKDASLFAATQFSSTKGDFSFAVPGNATNNSSFSRLNNDQHRINAVVKYQRQNSHSGTHVLGALTAHEGGVPGFAFSPTVNLRSKAFFGGISTGFSQKINNCELSVTLANSLFNYESTDQPQLNERFLASTHELTIGLDNLALPEWLDLKMAETFVVERAYNIDQTRIGGGFSMKRAMSFGGRLKPKSFATFGMMAYDKHGLVFKKDLGLSIEPTDKMLLSARAVRSQRLPTFMEMYANNRFLAGNADLNKESLWDFELGANVTFADYMRLALTGYMGYISDTIVYVRYMATKMRPTNTSQASRYGIDLAFTMEPSSWFMFETKNALLYSKIKDTDAPLPQSPPFLGLTRVRLGPEDIFALTLSSRYRGASSANIYGTARSNAYILFDALVAAPIGRYLSLSLSVANIFNTKTARDFDEMPLPGTTIFGQIELGNS